MQTYTFYRNAETYVVRGATLNKDRFTTSVTGDNVYNSHTAALKAIDDHYKN